LIINSILFSLKEDAPAMLPMDGSGIPGMILY